MQAHTQHYVRALLTVDLTAILISDTVLSYGKTLYLENSFWMQLFNNLHIYIKAGQRVTIKQKRFSTLMPFLKLLQRNSACIPDCCCFS